MRSTNDGEGHKRSNEVREGQIRSYKRPCSDALVDTEIGVMAKKGLSQGLFGKIWINIHLFSGAGGE